MVLLNDLLKLGALLQELGRLLRIAVERHLVLIANIPVLFLVDVVRRV